MNNRKSSKAVNKLKTLAKNPKLYKHNKVCALFQGGVISDEFITFIKDYTGIDISEYKGVGLLRFLSIFDHYEPMEMELDNFIYNKQIIAIRNVSIKGKPVRIEIGLLDGDLMGFSIIHRDDFYNSKSA